MRKITFRLSLLTALLLLVQAVAGQLRSDPWLEALLRKNASPMLNRILDHPDSFQYQLIYTRIDRNMHNKPVFKNYYLNVDRQRYHYPASTVKLPVALLALEQLNALNIPGLTSHTAMLTDSAYSGQTRAWEDSTAASGLPSVAHYIRKIFLVSDNDAYNRLYEFLGQQPLNEGLWKKGYPGIRITHRFVRLTAEENRHTNPVRFMDGAKLLYEQPARYSKLARDTVNRIFVGKRYRDNQDRLVEKPMDFTLRNRFPLEDLQHMLQAVLFPGSVPARQRFNLTPDDEQLLLTYMSAYPAEIDFPRYDTAEYFNSYTKFFFFRAGKSEIPPSIRVFNKAGWSYGFLTDAAYIVDFENNVEFMLSAVIYVNSDGTLNDDKYEYEEIGWPFFKAVGETIYRHELKRTRKYKPDLTRFKIRYNIRSAKSNG